MDTNVHYEVFEHDDSNELPEGFINYPVTLELQAIAREMVLGGFAMGNLIHIDKFLRPDLSINLEKLEIAILLTVRWIEANTPFDDPAVIHIAGLDNYYEIRNIVDNVPQKKEEYYFVRGYVKAVAENECFKPVTVDYVEDPADSHSRE